MQFTVKEKEEIKKDLVRSLVGEPEIRRIIVFGSFLNSPEPNDLDLAIIQDSQEGYYSLALKYRKRIRTIINRIPVDILPIRWNAPKNQFLQEIESGEILYER